MPRTRQKCDICVSAAVSSAPASTCSATTVLCTHALLMLCLMYAPR